jgi:hypothetical protein
LYVVCVDPSPRVSVPKSVALRPSPRVALDILNAGHAPAHWPLQLETAAVVPVAGRSLAK